MDHGLRPPPESLNLTVAIRRTLQRGQLCANVPQLLTLIADALKVGSGLDDRHYDARSPAVGERMARMRLQSSSIDSAIPLTMESSLATARLSSMSASISALRKCGLEPLRTVG
jgi:hypothetical protein